MASPSPRPDPPFSGHVIVFTGKLCSLSRKAAQSLVQRLGGQTMDEVTSKTTMLVVAAAPTPEVRTPEAAQDEVEKSRKLKKADQLNAKGGGRISIVTEQEFFGLAGLPSPDDLAQQFYGVREILGMYPALREDHLRYLAKWGLVQPVMRTTAGAYYRFPDLLILKHANAELAKGASFRAVLRSLAAQREGQLAFDFRPADPTAPTAKVIPLKRPGASAALLPNLRSNAAVIAIADPAVVEAFLQAFDFDDGNASNQERALQAYRKTLALDPNLVPALVNLANIHYARDQRIEAQALYERAIRLDPECFEAHFNLGHVFHDQGCYSDARACYRETIALNPAFADAHFYLAVTLEKLGESQEAKAYWRGYQELAPNGEWVELAREFSE